MKTPDVPVSLVPSTGVVPLQEDRTVTFPSYLVLSIMFIQ